MNKIRTWGPTVMKFSSCLRVARSAGAEEVDGSNEMLLCWAASTGINMERSSAQLGTTTKHIANCRHILARHDSTFDRRSTHSPPISQPVISRHYPTSHRSRDSNRSGRRKSAVHFYSAQPQC